MNAMKLILSRHCTPETHWTKWVEEGFDFSDYSQPWEHPGISPLAYETKATYGDLDLDSDSFLRSLVSQVWAEDFTNRSGDIDEKLAHDSKTFMELRETELDIFYREAFQVEDVPNEWLDQSEFAGVDLQAPYKWDDEFLSSASRGVTNEHMAIVNYYNEVIEPKICQLWKDIVVRMLVTGANPKRDTVVQHAVKLLWSKRCKAWKDSPDLLTERHKDEFFSQAEEKFQQWALESSYEAAITLFPADNLFSYFHDEIVFNNYIQRTVMYGREQNAEGGLVVPEDDETAFVTSRRLLDESDNVTEDEIRYLVERSHSWWT